LREENDRTQSRRFSGIEAQTTIFKTKKWCAEAAEYRHSTMALMKRCWEEAEAISLPRCRRAKELAEIAAAALGDDVFDLLVHHVFVARYVAPRAENPDGRWEVRAVLHVRELEGVCRTRMVRVVNDQIRLGDVVAKLYDFDVAVRFPADTLSRFLPKTMGLPCSSWRTCSLRASRSVSENHAPSLKMLQFCKNFHVGRTFVGGRVFSASLSGVLENVHGAGHESGFGSDGQRNGIERPV